jgi:hypothetical protein
MVDCHFRLQLPINFDLIALLSLSPWLLQTACIFFPRLEFEFEQWTTPDDTVLTSLVFILHIRKIKLCLVIYSYLCLVALSSTSSLKSIWNTALFVLKERFFLTMKLFRKISPGKKYHMWDLHYWFRVHGVLFIFDATQDISNIYFAF